MMLRKKCDVHVSNDINLHFVCGRRAIHFKIGQSINIIIIIYIAMISLGFMYTNLKYIMCSIFANFFISIANRNLPTIYDVEHIQNVLLLLEKTVTIVSL